MNCRWMLFVVAITLTTTAKAVDSDATSSTLGKLPARKVLFLGNSITLHGPSEKIGWEGNWGMAASSKEQDYVHLVTAEIAKSIGARPEIKVRNIAAFEREYETFDVATGLKDELGFRADIVIVAIGENVTAPATEEAKVAFAEAFSGLLDSVRQHGKPEIFVRSSFWPNSVKDDIMRHASEAAGATFIDITELGNDQSNRASAERDFEHAGVAAHPGDKGMQATASAIVAAIRAKAGVTE